MKKIGIVGGVGWRATVDYYSGLCHRSEALHLAHARQGSPSMPEMIIESLDLNKAVSYLGIDGDEESWLRFDEYHHAALSSLEAAGAEVAIMASNSPHHRFDTIVHGVTIPVISIFDVAARESARLGACQVLILGTQVTMNSPKFRQEFAKHGVEAAGPCDEAARAIILELIAELQLGRLDGAAERLGVVAANSFERQFKGQPIVCLACTELPLAFPELKSRTSFEYSGVLYINTTLVHINAAFDFALE
jgi:aspartate racemase